MKRSIKLLSFVACFGVLSLTPSCKKESNLTRVCMPKTVDGMNLYLTGVAKGNLSNTYVYLNDAQKDNDDAGFEAYAKEVYEKASKARPNADIAYFPITSDTSAGTKALNKLFTDYDKDTKIFKIVYIDTYQDGSSSTPTPTGVWIARDGWMKNTSTSRKFISGLVKTAEYRMSESNVYNEKGETIKKINNYDYNFAYRDLTLDTAYTNFSDMYDLVDSKYKSKSLPEFIFNDKNDKIVNYKTIYEYCSIFAAQNRGFGQPFNNDAILNNFKVSSSKSSATIPFINNTKAENLFGKIKELSDEEKALTENGATVLNTICDKFGWKKLVAGTSKASDCERFNFKHMEYGIYHCNDQSKPTSAKTAIILIGVGSGVAVLVIGLLVFRRIKTGRPLFSVKRALDIDIPLDDPRMVKKRKVAEHLKETRKALGMSLEDAAYLMHLTPQYLEKDIEAATIFVPKHLYAKFIVCYHLPNNYFDKEYGKDNY